VRCLSEVDGSEVRWEKERREGKREVKPFRRYALSRGRGAVLKALLRLCGVSGSVRTDDGMWFPLFSLSSSLVIESGRSF
jgi:hypothetical protein